MKFYNLTLTVNGTDTIIASHDGLTAQERTNMVGALNLILENYNTPGVWSFKRECECGYENAPCICGPAMPEVAMHNQQ